MANAVVAQKIKETVKGYTFFNPKLQDYSYASGDIYSKEQIAEAQRQWEITTEDRPYLKHVKALSTTWPHLRLLADFMEVSTTPIRWADFRSKKRSEAEREERFSRTNVTRLDYLDSGVVAANTYTCPGDLRDALKEETEETSETAADSRKFRLFVVEDLSRDVIELLGAHLDIEPAFFREYIVDYAWYNTRDRWFDPPSLNMVARRQRWLQLRFVTARYFKTTESFKNGFKEAESFNIFRRLDDDQNNKALWDDAGAIVGLTRTRASFWLRSADGQKKGAVGVLLVDPTIKEGTPLWYGYRNWEATPSINTTETPVGPPRVSLYKDLIYWAQRPGAFRTTSSDNPVLNSHIPIQALCHIVCAEWLTIADYIRTRLGQIEWEISFPEHFLHKGSNVDVALKKLHVWRRLVPLYREMLNETLQRVFHFPCHTAIPISNGSSLGSTIDNGANNSAGIDSSQHCQCCHQHSPPLKQGPIGALRDDFVRVLSYMEEYQQRIDRLTSVVTAIISIEDSRRGQADNRNVARLTWLATFFIPLSFVASLFSMQDDIGKLQETYKVYFEAALPLAALSLGLALILTLPSVRRLGRRIKSWLRIADGKN